LAEPEAIFAIIRFDASPTDTGRPTSLATSRWSFLPSSAAGP